MKTAISAVENSFKSNIDMHFARCGCFVIYDHQSGSTEFLPNPYLDRIEDVGLLAVELMHSKGVSKVVAGDFGVKVKPLFDSLHIQMLVVPENRYSVEDIINIINKTYQAMPKMDGTGPDGKGASTGRGLGRCNNPSQKEKHEQLGKGMGDKKKTGGGKGKGRRTQGGIK
jgi:predicted Fe-Mo cluster-binding NifX family protein